MITEERIEILSRALSDYFAFWKSECARPVCLRTRTCRLSVGLEGKAESGCWGEIDQHRIDMMVAIGQTAYLMMEGQHLSVPSEDQAKREREEAAIDFIKATYPRSAPERRRFNPFLKDYRTPPLTAEQRRALIEEAKRMLAEDG